MFLFFRQIVLDPFALEVRWQCPPSSPATLFFILSAAGVRARRNIVRFRLALGVGCLFGSVELLRKQAQLIGAQVFTARAAFGRQQLAQQALCLV